MNESNKEQFGHDVCKNHSARSDRADLSHISPSKLSKRELEDLYFVLLDNNLELKRTINDQRDQIKVLSTKVLRMTAAQKCTLGKEQKVCCAKTKAVVIEQRESIAELKRTNERMAERIRLLNMRLCSAKQFLKRSPTSMSKCPRCSATTTSLKNLSISALNTKLSETNLRTVNAVSCQYLDKQASVRNVETETVEKEKESPEKLCNENRCRTLMEELKQKIIYLQEELSKTHEEYSIRVSRLEEEMTQRARSDRAASLHSLEQKERKTQELTAQLRDAKVQSSDLSMQLCIEKKKVAELETRLKVSQTTNAVARTIEEHLSNVSESKTGMKESSHCEYNPSLVYPAEWDKFSPRLEVPTTSQQQSNLSPDSTVLYGKQHESKNSDDSGYVESNQTNIPRGDKVADIINQELVQKIADLQSQLDYLKISAAEKKSFDFESYDNCVESQMVKIVKDNSSIDLNVKKEDTEEDRVNIDDDSKEHITQKEVTAYTSLLNVPEAYKKQSLEKNDFIEEFNTPWEPESVTADKRESYIESSKIKDREEVTVDTFLINKDAITEREIDNNEHISSFHKIASKHEDISLDKDAINNEETKKDIIDSKANVTAKRDSHNSFQIPGPLPTKKRNGKPHIANINDGKDILIEKGDIKNNKVDKRKIPTHKTDRKQRKLNKKKAQSFDSKILIKGQSFEGNVKETGIGSTHNITDVGENRTIEEVLPAKAEHNQLGTEIDPKLGHQTPHHERRSSTPSQHRTYTIEASAELIKCSRTTSPENTDCEIYTLPDLPCEKNDKSPRELLSPGEDKATSTYTTSYSVAASTEYESLSEGELPTNKGGRKLSIGERRMSECTPDTKFYPAESSSHKMEAALHAIGEELARCRQLLQMQKPEPSRAEKPEYKDASATTEQCIQPSSLALRRSTGKPRIGTAYAPKCMFTLHVGTVVLSDEAVISSRDLSLMLMWKFYDQPAAMTRMRAGRVMHFDFSTEYDVNFTDNFLDYLKHEEMPITICELDNQDRSFARCALPLRDALLHTNRRADMSLALLAGPQLRQSWVAKDHVDARDEIGVLDLWCMLRADPQLLPAINRAIAKYPLTSQADFKNFPPSIQRSHRNSSVSNDMDFYTAPKNKQYANNSPFDNFDVDSWKKMSTDRESKRAVIIEPQQDFKPTLSSKDVMCPPRVDITVLWLALNEECEAMLNPNVRRLYVAYSFLGRNGAELETPVSLPKPKHYVDKCFFHFKKTFHLMESDLLLLGHMAKCRSANKGVPNNKDCVVFTVISEPPEDPLGLNNCEDIGRAYLYLGDLLAYCTGDSYTEVVPIRAVQAEDSVCGVLAIMVEGLDVVRKCLDYLQEKGESP